MRIHPFSILAKILDFELFFLAKPGFLNIMYVTEKYLLILNNKLNKLNLLLEKRSFFYIHPIFVA